MTNLLFQELSDSILDEILRWDPSQATQLGWHKYDKELRDPSPQAFQTEATRLRQLVSELERLDPQTLSADELVDRDLGIYLFKIRIFEIERLRFHERMALALEDIGNSLYFLFVRDDQPIETRFEAIASRLEKVPEYLDRARTALLSPCRSWNEVCLETGRALPQFIDEISVVAQAMVSNQKLATRIQEAARAAIDAIILFNRWLEEDVLPEASEQRAISQEDLEEYLRLRGFGLTAGEATELANKFLDVAREKMVAQAKAICSTKAPLEAINFMRRDHPKTVEGLLKAYREQIGKTRDFVIENDLMTVPEGEKLLVIETPLFMRHTTPYAAQCEPGKFTGDKTGLFMVTPPGSPEHLRDHCHATIANTAVHEGYPGHHLQGIWANTNQSPIRALCGVPEFCEGWALYCEDLMISQGFNDSPIGRMAQLNDLTFRIIRVIADVGLSTGQMTCEQFADMLVKEVGMEREPAILDARTYTYSPTYFLSYFIGKIKLMQLRSDVEKVMGNRFSLKFFHDTMLGAGSLPIDFMRRILANALIEKYGIILPEPAQSVYEYSLSLADDGGC